MKNLVTLATLMAGVGLAVGQPIIHNPGIVNFQNTESTKAPGVPSHLVTNAVSGTLLVGTQYKAELYYMDTTLNSLQPIVATLSSFKSTTATSLLGTWNGPANPIPLPAGYGGIDVQDDGAGGFIEAGDGTGTGTGYYPVVMMVRVWDSTFGATYETATAGPRGSSAQFNYVQRYSSPPATSDSQMIAQRAFSVVAVPEPSAIALSILGVAGLLLIRRRK